MEKEIYFVPVKLSEQFKLFGLTVNEMLLVLSSGVLCFILALQGAFVLIAVPLFIFVFSLKVEKYHNKPIWQVLLMVYRFHHTDNMYSLEECKRLWK